MKLPSYQEFMYPFLKLLENRETLVLKDAYQELADHFGLDEEQRQALTPSGNQTVLHNRVGWARTYLKKAVLIENVSKGVFSLTDRGREVLDNPAITDIDDKFLAKYPEFREFKGIKNSMPASDQDTGPTTKQQETTPEDSMQDSFRQLKLKVKDDLLEKVMDGSPAFFEKVVVDLLLAMGYGGTDEDAGEAIGRSGDEGVDGVIKEDVLGLDLIYVQAKRWEGTVSRPEIQKFAGSLEGKRAKKGVFITTSSFSEGAKEYVKYIEKKIVLIDGNRLTDYMFEFGVGVSPHQTYVIKRVDEDYFVSNE